MDLSGLLIGELRLTLDILLGLALGMFIIRTGLAGRLMACVMPYLRRAGVGPLLGMAMTVSIGSAKAGAALLASALENGRISARTAKWGTLMLAFPAYLRRWPSTLIMAVSLAGISGAIFAAVILLRTAAKFFILLFFLKNGEHGEPQADGEFETEPAGTVRFGMMFLKTLPLAWFFYAMAYLFVPYLETELREWLLGGAYLPLAALAIAAASIAHVSAALALAGGSLAAGDITVPQAVFALLLGNSFGIITRMIRSNAGYYFGLFPGGLAKSMLLLNLGTTAPLALLTLTMAAIPLFL